MSKVLQEREFGSLPRSTETNPRDHVESILTIVEADASSIRRASISVMPLSTVKLADRTVKYPKGIVENVLVGIELNDLNVPLELRRYQVDDLMPTIEEGEVVEEFRARNDARMEYKGNNVVGALMNIPIFVETFSILTNFAVLEDMDAYRDE
ncbi:hypothetical protein Tco_1377572 [Tanacetum coccineum]